MEEGRGGGGERWGRGRGEEEGEGEGEEEGEGEKNVVVSKVVTQIGCLSCTQLDSQAVHFHSSETCSSRPAAWRGQPALRFSSGVSSVSPLSVC